MAKQPYATTLTHDLANRFRMVAACLISPVTEDTPVNAPLPVGLQAQLDALDNILKGLQEPRDHAWVSSAIESIKFAQDFIAACENEPGRKAQLLEDGLLTEPSYDACRALKNLITSVVEPSRRHFFLVNESIGDAHCNLRAPIWREAHQAAMECFDDSRFPSVQVTWNDFPSMRN